MKLLMVLVLCFPAFSQASVWVEDVKVSQMSAYQHSEYHFVWLSKVVSTCNSTLGFNEASAGGKSLFSFLLAAQLSRANLNVQVEGCDILEVYIKPFE